MALRDCLFKRGSTNGDPSEGKENEGEQLEEWVEGIWEEAPVHQQPASFRARQAKPDLERMKNAHRRTQHHIGNEEAWLGSLKHDLPAFCRYYRNGLFLLFFANQDGWRGFSSSRGFFKGGFPSPPAEFAVIRPPYPEFVRFRGSKTFFTAQFGCLDMFRTLSVLLFPDPGEFYNQIFIEETRSGPDSHPSSSLTPAVLPP